MVKNTERLNIRSGIIKRVIPPKKIEVTIPKRAIPNRPAAINNQGDKGKLVRKKPF